MIASPLCVDVSGKRVIVVDGDSDTLAQILASKLDYTVVAVTREQLDEMVRVQPMESGVRVDALRVDLDAIAPDLAQMKAWTDLHAPRTDRAARRKRR